MDVLSFATMLSLPSGGNSTHSLGVRVNTQMGQTGNKKQPGAHIGLIVIVNGTSQGTIGDAASLKWRGVQMAVVAQWGSTVIIFGCDVLAKHCTQSRWFPDAHMCAWWEARSAGRIKPKASKHIPQASCLHIGEYNIICVSGHRAPQCMIATYRMSLSTS
ncbi:hypothetical protein BJ912DRAFT_936050 [Pholiota molesta]|nr:hypothetical protein BJ912DRAFT_936050 [Pholiota molesta]